MEQKLFDEMRIKYGFQQDGNEFFEFLNIVESISPKIILEIGISEGGSLRFFKEIVSKNNGDNSALIIGVDKDLQLSEIQKRWGIPFIEVYSDQTVSCYINHENEQDVSVKLINGDSTQFNTIKRVKDILNGRKLDFLHLDGGHYYNMISSDYKVYSKLVRDGGLIAFHDVGRESGVIKVFNSIVGNKKVIHYPPEGLGTGIYWKDTK